MIKDVALVATGVWLGAGVLALATTPSLAEDLTGREIMQRVEDRDDGDRSIMDLEMILIDKAGNQRERRLRAFGMDKGEDEWMLLFFVTPADVKDTGFLTYDYDDSEKDDDQWLYLPALKKTKRIASNDKSGSFMGSDFTYSDMTSRNLDAYEYTVMKESEVDGVKVWQIQAVPQTKKEIDETGYIKSILFVRQDNYVVIRGVNWLKRGGRLKYLDVKQLDLIDGIWVMSEIHMTTKKSKKTLHKTVLKNQNVRFNQDIDEDDFTVRRLEKGL